MNLVLLGVLLLCVVVLLLLSLRLVRAPHAPPPVSGTGPGGDDDAPSAPQTPS